MVGYAAFDSPRPFEVVAWRSIGLMRAGAWKGGLLSGNLGWSLKQEKVSTLIQERIVNTLRLMGPALLLSILIALPLGPEPHFAPDRLLRPEGVPRPTSSKPRKRPKTTNLGPKSTPRPPT